MCKNCDNEVWNKKHGYCRKCYFAWYYRNHLERYRLDYSPRNKARRRQERKDARTARESTQQEAVA